MSRLQQIPLGTRIPNSLHAVSVSLPTMADVIGYETKDPPTMARLKSGYPRFVMHECLVEIETFWKAFFARPDDRFWLVSSERMARLLEAHLASSATKYYRHQGVSGLRLPDDEDLNQKAKLFLRRTGGFLSSRQAEDYCVANGLREKRFPEQSVADESAAKIQSALAPWLATSNSQDVILANSGMNAVFSTIQAIAELQSDQGRNIWIVLGWLYVDTTEVLKNLLPSGSALAIFYDVFDIAALEDYLEKNGSKVAGLLTEAPTNPLVQTMDLERVYALCSKHGLFAVVDPSLNSPINFDVSPYADVIVNSLTKYAANEGDVIMGAATATAQCPQRDRMLAAIREWAEAPYARDLSRLASQIGRYRSLVQQTNASVAAVVAFLETHSNVKRVYWAREERSAGNYAKLARSPDAVGGMISFEVKGQLQDFYDRTLLAKGPSFGQETTLICPFIYLAHYDLVTTPAGRRTLAEAGIPTDLLRLSIGSEPVDKIIAALNVGLG